MSILQAHGITAQTSPYPLALADIHENMHSSPKSQFLASLSSSVQFDKVVCTACGILSSPPRDLGVIIDLLYFIHMPPSPSVSIFYDYFQLLWQQTVGKYVTYHQVSYIYLVIDKPDYLPPPRSIVHESRSSKSKSNQDSIAEPTVTDESQILHGKAYSSLLAKCRGFKAKLIEYLTEKFISHATSNSTIFL